MPVFHSYAHNMACQVCSIKIYLIKVHCWLNLISQHTVLRILQSFTSNFEIKFKNKNYMCMFFLYTLHSIVSERIWLKFSIWKDIFLEITSFSSHMQLLEWMGYLKLRSTLYWYYSIKTVNVTPPFLSSIF